MIKLERNDAMTRAIARAKQVRPFVKWLGGRTYSATSRDGQRVYTVRFEVRNGHKLGECNCKAGVKGQLCYHIAAAAAVNIAIASMHRHNASPSIPASPTEQPSSAPAAARYHSHKCSNCKAEIECDFPYCDSMSELIYCPACYAAGYRIKDEVTPSVYPPAVTIAQAHARAC